MAAAIASSRLLVSSLTRFSGFLSNSVRWASKKQGTTPRNKRKQTPGKHRGCKKSDGSFVHRGEILVKQLGLRFYPGENVGILRDKSLYALEDGKVFVTCEKLSPYPDSPLFEPIQNGVVIHKKFFHVMAVPLHGKFRLVSQI